MIEWYKRIKMLNKGEDPVNSGFGSVGELSANYNKLTTDEVKEIAKNYKIDYIIRNNDRVLDLPIVYKDDKNTVYRLE